jgi:hypothetical protein
MTPDEETDGIDGSFQRGTLGRGRRPSMSKRNPAEKKPKNKSPSWRSLCTTPGAAGYIAGAGGIGGDG